MTASCLYEGWVRHRRREPLPHAFNYPLFMVYLDLAELDEVFRGRWFWSSRRRALARFDRADQIGDPRVPLDTAVRDLVEDQTGCRPAGPIRLLTHLRYFGYVFNPVSFYYCFDRAGDRLDTIVADVSNTPWGERHQYVLPTSADSRIHRFELAKVFHVSPFMPMDVDYDWRFSNPGNALTVHMRNEWHGLDMFDATLVLRHRPITGASLARVLVRSPAMTMRVVAAIYWQALRLWMKGAPFHPHPRSGSLEVKS